MKFLCRECDTAMKFKDVTRPEQGSVTAVFECPDCFVEFAMFLNPWETQMLKSLDLQLGGTSEGGATDADGAFAARNRQTRADARHIFLSKMQTRGELLRVAGVP